MSLLLLLGLLGCHKDEPEAVERAKLELAHEKQTFTDRASLLYAQQELALADEKTAAARVGQSTAHEEAERAASYHVQQARLQLKLDTDNLQFDRDMREWKALATMLNGLQSHEGQP